MKPNILDRQPGTYALVLASRGEKRIRIGGIGTLRLRTGFYVYVGSALGPGGLARAREASHDDEAGATGSVEESGQE